MAKQKENKETPQKRKKEEEWKLLTKYTEKR